MKVINLASGSSGNCSYIEADGTRILIDCGISASAAAKELDKNGISADSIQGIFISHEHHDHIDGAFAFSKKFKKPLYMNLGTYAATNHKLNGSEIRHFATGDVLPFGNVDIQFFPVSHDTADPVGFRIHSDEGEIVHATDFGIANNGLGDYFNSARMILMDFNHDMEMLIKGPYPIFLKERIAGNRGHLSNEAASKFLAELELPNLEALILAHISRTNNVPTVARATVMNAFANRPRTPKILTADQYRSVAVETS